LGGQSVIKVFPQPRVPPQVNDRRGFIAALVHHEINSTHAKKNTLRSQENQRFIARFDALGSAARLGKRFCRGPRH